MKPSDVIVIHKNGKQVDWKATGKKITETIEKDFPGIRPSEKAMFAIDYEREVRNLVKRIGSANTIEHLKNIRGEEEPDV